MPGANGEGIHPLPFTEIWALRTDWEDVPVEQLGGTVLRLYALTGTARAELLEGMISLSRETDEKDPATIRAILDFQGKVVAASLGYPREEWSGLGAVMGSGTIEALYEIAARLSGLDEGQQTQATERLRRRRSAASGIA